MSKNDAWKSRCGQRNGGGLQQDKGKKTTQGGDRLPFFAMPSIVSDARWTIETTPVDGKKGWRGHSPESVLGRRFMSPAGKMPEPLGPARIARSRRIFKRADMSRAARLEQSRVGGWGNCNHESAADQPTGYRKAPSKEKGSYFDTYHRSGRSHTASMKLPRTASGCDSHAQMVRPWATLLLSMMLNKAQIHRKGEAPASPACVE